MTPRGRRAAMVGGGLAALGLAAGLVFYALRGNLVYFYTPTQVASKEAPEGRTFRIGGLVVKGSVKRDASDQRIIQFEVTDNAKTIPVRYQGILPDLFSEGRGVVAQGRVGPDGTFVAGEVLAKHDETYMPPEAAEALRKAGHPVGTPQEFLPKKEQGR